MDNSQDYFKKRRGAESVLTNLTFKPLKDSQLVSTMSILSYLINLQKLIEMRITMFNVQLRMMRYRSTNILAGSNRNIRINTRECFTLIDCWPTLYTCLLP